MIYLGAAVVIVGCLCVLDLLLTVAVIRRLREQGEALAALSGGERPDETLLSPGTQVPDVLVVTSDGSEARLRSFGTGFLLAFLSTHCDACHEQLPSLERYAHKFPGGRDSVLAVISGDSDGKALVDRVKPIARLVTERENGPITSAFSVNIWPAYLVVGPDGMVDATGHAIEELPLPATHLDNS